MVPVIVAVVFVGAIAVAALCLYIYFSGDRWKYRSLCPTNHQIGGLTVRHYARVPCQRAEEVGRMAERVWQESQAPSTTLWIISDSARRDGWFFDGQLVVNLAAHTGDEDLWATLRRLFGESRVGLLRAQGRGV